MLRFALCVTVFGNAWKSYCMIPVATKCERTQGWVDAVPMPCSRMSPVSAIHLAAEFLRSRCLMQIERPVRTQADRLWRSSKFINDLSHLMQLPKELLSATRPYSFLTNDWNSQSIAICCVLEFWIGLNRKRIGEWREIAASVNCRVRVACEVT